MRTSTVIGILFIGLATLSAAAEAQKLDYKGRYNCQAGEPDHMMCVAALSGDRALAGGNMGVAVVDLKTLPVGGTRVYLSRLKGVDARDLYVRPAEDYVFVNGYRGGGIDSFGFYVLALKSSTLTIATTVRESGVLYDKMCLDGNYLYVAAHGHGIRIFNVTTPTAPTLVGQLATGFTDAFAITVDGNTAYVADGGGGLKIVDVTTKSAPKITAGETLATAVGTAEDVTVKNGRVYVAAGSAGLLVYEVGKLNTRQAYPLRAGAAESLCWVGSHLAVGTIAGVEVFAIGTGTAVTRVCHDTAHRRGSGASLRLLNDVAASGNRLLTANWNFAEMYELNLGPTAAQADIECSAQRLRFPPAGGRRRVTVSNNGGTNLTISKVQASTGFTVDWGGGTLAAGASRSFTITAQNGAGSGTVLLASNDPDENPLPIQVFATTTYLDPGETAKDFTLNTYVRDPKTGKPTPGSAFTLSKKRGQVVWFTVFATW